MKLPFFSHCLTSQLSEIAFMKKAIRDYLSYSRKEMIGVFSFVLLLIIMAIVPAMIPEPKQSFAEIDLNKELDSLFQGENIVFADSAGVLPAPKTSPKEFTEKIIPNFFVFDPNTISDEEWKRLGVKEKAIVTINKYKAHGGVFKNPEDILKLYGLSDKLKKSLVPYVKIRERSQDVPLSQRRDSVKMRKEEGYHSDFARPVTRSIDINKADSADWERLPGIGSKLAARIVKFRERLGGFVSASQISEVYGIQDSVYQKIRPMLVGGGEVEKLKINSAEERALSQHPYIQFKLARLLIQYKKAHGPLRGVDDLLAIAGFNSTDVEKLKPYLSFD